MRWSAVRHLRNGPPRPSSTLSYMGEFSETRPFAVDGTHARAHADAMAVEFRQTAAHMQARGARWGTSQIVGGPILWRLAARRGRRDPANGGAGVVGPRFVHGRVSIEMLLRHLRRSIDGRSRGRKLRGMNTVCGLLPLGVIPLQEWLGQPEKASLGQ